jgi:hypothetical protein
MDGNKKYYYRVIILFLFFISFTLESLLPFYSIVLLYIFNNIHQKNKHEKTINIIKKFISHHSDFIFLPILYFTLKLIFNKPYGLYDGYNAISLAPLSIAKLVLQSFQHAFYLPIFNSFYNAWLHIALTFIVLFATTLILRKVTISTPPEALLGVHSKIKILGTKYHVSPPTPMIPILGLIFFCLAVFPYCAVNKLPQATNWGSRHQVLVPLGMAFITFYLILLTTKIHKKIPGTLMNITISAFIIQNLCTYYLYDVDWFYQMSLLEQFTQSKTIQRNTTFIVKDNLQGSIWVNKRGLSFYEVNGLFKRGFNEDKRLAMAYNMKEIENYTRFKESPEYNFSHWKNSPPVLLEFRRNFRFSLTWNIALQLFYYDLFDKPAFEKNISNLTEIIIS